MNSSKLVVADCCELRRSLLWVLRIHHPQLQRDRGSTDANVELVAAGLRGSEKVKTKRSV